MGAVRKKASKKVQFFDQEDIERFIETACSKEYRNGQMENRYRYGHVLSANIYLGLRIGELLALQWKDIDFESNTIFVSKTLAEIDNPKYRQGQEEKMRKKGISKVIYEIQQSTKTSKNRYVPVNARAKELLEEYRKTAQYTDPEDYVISTVARKTSEPKSIMSTITAIEKRAGTKTQYYGTHILRHTCASLYFRAGVPPATIAQILGNTVDVLLSTYVHVTDEQMKEAASKVAACI